MTDNKLKGLKGLMRKLLSKTEHTTLTGQAAERAAQASTSKPKSMTPWDHAEYDAWQAELERLDQEGPGKSTIEKP